MSKIAKHLLSILLFSGSLLAQDNRIFHHLRVQGDTIWVKSKIVLGEDQRKSDSAFIHLPMYAYTEESSLLNQQLREYQEVDLHFADAAEKGFFRWQGEKDRVESQYRNTEFLKLSKNPDSDTIFLDFYFLPPQSSFTGNGRAPESLRLIDLLPRPAAFINGNWRLDPLTYHYDRVYGQDYFDVSIEATENQQIVSNLPLISNEGGVALFEGGSRHLFLFIAPENTWQEASLPQGKSLFDFQVDRPYLNNLQIQQNLVNGFFWRELGDSLNDYQKILVLDDKGGKYQSAELLVLDREKRPFQMGSDLALAQAEAKIRAGLGTDGFKEAWLARGLPYYYKYRFIQEVYPQKTWVPFQNRFTDWLFGFDRFDYGYQNRFLFLFLQRQGLDQAQGTRVDSLSRLNYEAILQAKTYLNISHLRAYIGEKDFKRSLSRFLNQGAESDFSSAKDLQASLNYYSPKPTDWYFSSSVNSAEINDYQLLEYDHCPTVSTATVRNSGHLSTPYSITGFKDGKAVLTQWYEGHEGKRNVQLYHEEYDKVVINAHLRHAENRQKNNTVYSRWLLPRMEPLSFQFYNSFEAAEATQVFYVPSVYYNAYDQFLLGINLSNRSLLVQKPFEYILVPEFSTGTQKLTGTGSLSYRWTTPKNHFFRQIQFGLYGRYYHYDRDLAYTRISPAINFFIRKPYPRSPYIQTGRIRGVIVNREQAPNLGDLSAQQDAASYQVLNLSYRLEDTRILKPVIFRTHLEIAERFGKAFMEYDQRWMLGNKKWLVWRSFAGAFLYNRRADQGINDNFYSFGLSASPDYLFDYYLIGRSDQSGIWSRQFFVSDGGFRSETDVFSDRFMLSTSLSVPIWQFAGLFADAALTEEGFYWDYGLRMAFLTDFIELYLPIRNQDRNFIQEANYLSNVRFVLDFDLGNIINRVRRGFY